MFKIVERILYLIEPFSERMSIEDAIRKSIAKWEFIYQNVDNIIDGSGGITCALCFEFAKQRCLPCPIMKDTGKVNCDSTPWWNAHSALSFSKNSVQKKRMVKLEVDYLKKILADYLEEKENEI